MGGREAFQAHGRIGGRQLPCTACSLQGCSGRGVWCLHGCFAQPIHSVAAVLEPFIPSFAPVCREDFAAVLPQETPGPPPCCTNQFY